MSNLFETKRVSKIFAYTKEAKLDKKTLKMLTDDGYIPIPVESLDCIRVFEPIPDAESNIIFDAAIQTLMSGDSFTDNKKKFGELVLKSFAKSKTEKLTDEKG
jgi:hypothetical protein